MKTRKGSKGFTLIELVVVIAILAVLAAIAVPMITNYLARGKERAYNADKAAIQLAVDAYYVDADNPRFLGLRQYPLIGMDQTDYDTLTVKESSTTYPDDGDPIAAGNWNPLGGTQGNDISDTWTDDGDGVREIEANSPDTWTTVSVERNGETYWVDARYYFIDMELLVDEGYFTEVPESAAPDNGGTGSYIWYVDEDGNVQSLYYHFPEESGFQDAYP